MDGNIRGDTFAVLKRTLRARGMTYADLGREMGLSEPSVKRIFAQKDTKISRLFDICAILDVPFADIVARAARTKDTPSYLALETEMALAADPLLFYVFVLLRETISPSEIKDRLNLGEHALFQMGMQLERLDLVEMRENGAIKVMLSTPLLFRRHGPLHKIVRRLNLTFLGHIIDTPDSNTKTFVTLSRQMLPDTASEIRKDLQALHEKIAILARQDQLIADDDDLETFKFGAGFGPVSFPEMIEALSED